MKMINAKSIGLFSASLLLLPAGALAQSSGCPCPALGPPNNGGDVTISAPWHITHDFTAADNPAYFTFTVNSGPSVVPPGTYLGWCVDANNSINQGPATYSTLFLASCDPNLNQELGPGYPPDVYVSPDVWHEVNYILNHKNGAYFWNIQMAIWNLVGGPIPPEFLSGPPDFPPTDLNQVNALLAAAQANAAAWQPQCGDTIAIVVQIPSTVSLIQLVILEAPCTCPPSQGGCRVTGGSNKQLNTFQGPCVLTAAPSFVSHGGQVGASDAGETEFTPYSLCISGEWEHDRHLTQNNLVGVLHAAGNGNTHQFDSLLCACLPCDTTPGAVGTVGEVCNPNDRNCGPLPSKAPANKICFSGVGDYTDSNGPKTIKAVFRVDIEDRSEGNSPSSNPPPDRYRIRIWLLNTTCRPFGPDSAQGLALRFAVSADASTIGNVATTEQLKLPAVAGAPDIDDGGDMTQGNHQIHPETGSTCP